MEAAPETADQLMVALLVPLTAATPVGVAGTVGLGTAARVVPASSLASRTATVLAILLPILVFGIRLVKGIGGVVDSRGAREDHPGEQIDVGSPGHVGVRAQLETRPCRASGRLQHVGRFHAGDIDGETSVAAHQGRFQMGGS